MPVPKRHGTLRFQMATPEKMTTRVLVVDDEPMICDSISKILGSDEYEVETATSGQAGLDAFQRSKFDLVILDYEMPDQKGDKIAAAIRAFAPQQPIIMMTAYGESLRFGGSFPLPVDLVIGKPFAWQEFREAVHKFARKA